MNAWIYCTDRLPEERDKAYQVIATTTKVMGGNYAGMLQRGFYQDWVVRRWPQNFTAWMEAPPHIPAP